jgi:hypothetical protein
MQQSNWGQEKPCEVAEKYTTVGNEHGQYLMTWWLIIGTPFIIEEATINP